MGTQQISDISAKLDAAVAAGKLSATALTNIKKWLTEPPYGDYVPQILEHVEGTRWQELDDAFWTVIPFGTGGRRGRMYPIGCNAINDRTIGESAQGLANYLRELLGDRPLACAIAYDTRHRSRDFAELCGGIMAANGFQVYFLDGHRGTPELSFAVRFKKCDCGIMVTASHNPPSDNAVKVYWSTGGQLLPPHDKGVIERVEKVSEIRQIPFAEALALGKVVNCQADVDAAFNAQVLAQRQPGPRDLKIIYSPLHGVGATCVLPALEGDGFKDVEVFGPHAKPDGDFPNVPGHVSNPENPAVFDAIIARGREVGADVILATDPDCDRLGCAAPVTSDVRGEWRTFTGNQIGALLTDFLLERRSAAKQLTGEHYVVKTLVTTEMIRRIADSYGVRTYGNLQVGFKWIAGLMDEVGPVNFVLGTEESHGYQVGTYTRDKDGAVASMLLAELAAGLKAQGKTMHEKLDDLFWQHGCHIEQTISVTMPGSAGMERMRAVMARFRKDPPRELAGHRVSRVRDYLNGTICLPSGENQPLDGPPGDMVIIDLETEGNYIAVRPSGTEPKVKYYFFVFEPAEQLANLETAKRELLERVRSLEKALEQFTARDG